MNTQATKLAQPDELVGRVLNDRFRIISVIARGGMGRVYRAEQVPLGRLVAVKTLDPRNTGGEHDPQFQQRFFLEASIASKLQHPNTVTVFDYGRTVDDLYFIVMELVEGRSLLSLIRNEAPLPGARVIPIALQIARSLREAHRLDVIHRDLKPGNVLLTRHGDEDDFVKVLDFGLVKHVESEADLELTKAGLFMGSPKYMSPEQIRGEQRVDPRADIYALGVVMYEMLSGKVPFDRENTVKVLMAHLHDPVPPLSAVQGLGASEELVQLVMSCLAKDPDQRPASMDVVIARLKLALGGPTQVSGSFALSQEARLPSQAPATLVTSRGAPTPSGGIALGVEQPPQLPSSQEMRLQNESGVITHPGHATLAGAPTVVTQPAPPGWLPKIAVVSALAIAGGFLALRFSERGIALSAQPSAPVAQPASNPMEPGPATPAVEPAVAEPAAPPQQQAHALVRLSSNPSGAVVSADGKIYGQTPADIEWWGELAQPGRQLTFEFKKDGFETVTVVRTLHDEKLDVEVTLPPIEEPTDRTRHRRSRRSSASAESEPKAPLVVPKDFKEDPY